MLDTSLQIYIFYLNLLDKIHHNLFEFYLKFLRYKIIDYSDFYYFEYDSKYLIYNSNKNILNTIKNYYLINRIDNIVYYEERYNRLKIIFKFNNKKDFINNFLDMDLDDNNIDKFFSNLNENEQEYVKEKINNLEV